MRKIKASHLEMIPVYVERGTQYDFYMNKSFRVGEVWISPDKTQFNTKSYLFTINGEEVFQNVAGTRRMGIGIVRTTLTYLQMKQHMVKLLNEQIEIFEKQAIEYGKKASAMNNVVTDIHLNIPIDDEEKAKNLAWLERMKNGDKND